MTTIARRLRNRRINARNLAQYDRALRTASPSMRHELEAAAAHHGVRIY